jgi:tagatose-1,6-bisphosphate aldolase non-catalytic subunit AgaZ/GatZ
MNRQFSMICRYAWPQQDIASSHQKWTNLLWNVPLPLTVLAAVD